MSEEKTDLQKAEELIAVMADVCFESLEYFAALDAVNSRIQLFDQDKISPITEHCKEAVNAWRNWMYPPL